MDNPAQKTTRHINPKTGKVYIYSVESYWDKTKKAPRNRQRLIGSLDPVSGASFHGNPSPLQERRPWLASPHNAMSSAPPCCWKN